MSMPEIKYQNVQYVANKNVHFHWEQKRNLPLAIQLLEQGEVVTEIELKVEEATQLMHFLVSRLGK